MESDQQQKWAWLNVIGNLLNVVGGLLTLFSGVIALGPWALRTFGVVSGIEVEVPALALPAMDLADTPLRYRILGAFFLVFLYSWFLSYVSVRLAVTRNPAGHALAALFVFLAALMVCSTILEIGFNGVVPEVDGQSLFQWCAVGFGMFNLCAAGHYWKYRTPRDSRFDHALWNSVLVSFVGFLLAYSGIVYVEDAEDIAAKAVKLKDDRARFLDCPSKQAGEIRTNFPNMSTALYCWGWQRFGGSDGSLGNLMYSAQIVAPNSIQPLLWDACPVKRESDFFVGGNRIGSGVAILPNSDYAIVACRSYSNSQLAEWKITLATAHRQKKILLRCGCRELGIDLALFDSATGQLTLDVTAMASFVYVAGRSVWMEGSNYKRVVITLDNEFGITDVR